LIGCKKTAQGEGERVDQGSKWAREGTARKEKGGEKDALLDWRRKEKISAVGKESEEGSCSG